MQVLKIAAVGALTFACLAWQEAPKQEAPKDGGKENAVKPVQEKQNNVPSEQKKPTENIRQGNEQKKPPEHQEPAKKPPEKTNQEKPSNIQQDKRFETVTKALGEMQAKLAALEKGQQSITEQMNQQLSKLEKDQAGLLKKAGGVEGDLSQLKQRLAEMEKEQAELLKNGADVKKAFDNLATELAKLKEKVSPADTSKPPYYAIAPHPIKGKVMTQPRREDGTMMIKPGKDLGVKVGYRFRVLQDHKPIAVIEVIKVDFQETNDDRFAKTKILEGRIEDIRLLDDVEAMTEPTKTETPPQPLRETAKVKGLVAGQVMINRGRLDNVKEGNRIQVLAKDKSVKAIVIIDHVESDTAFGKVDKATAKGEVEREDEIVLAPEGGEASPVKILRVSPTGPIAVDMTEKTGAKVGQRYEVLRDGKKVAELVIKEVQSAFSLADPAEGFKKEDIKEGDVVKLKQ